MHVSNVLRYGCVMREAHVHTTSRIYTYTQFQLELKHWNNTFPSSQFGQPLNCSEQ